VFYYPGRPAPVSIVILCRFCCYGMTLCAKFFFRASNGIFGKVGRIASEEVLISLQLLNIKCLPILLYSLEVCNLSRRNLQSLDFTVNRFVMKLFNTNNMHIVTGNTCQLNFAFELPSVILPKRLIKFESATDGSCFPRYTACQLLTDIC